VASGQRHARQRTAPNRVAGDRKISKELDPFSFPVPHFSVFAQSLTKNAPPKLSE
jgi:hypothetical protein